MSVSCDIGNANPGGIFQTRVYGFDHASKPGYPGLWLCQSGGRPVVTVGLGTVSSHLSEVESWGREPWTVSYTAAGC